MYRIPKFFLLKLIGAFLILLVTFYSTQAQSDFKQKKHRFFNIIGGYRLMPGSSKLNNRLASDYFPKLFSPHYIFGIDYGSASKRGIVKMQFSNTGAFVGKSSHYSLLRTASISFKYGSDILPKVARTYLYPFVGYNLLIYNFVSNNSTDSTEGQKLSATKIDFDLVTGVGIKQFFKKEFIGLFSNIDINAGISIPTITGKWRQKGSNYLVGMYRLQSVFDFTASIGF
ncbi:MAG: hypothetical protein M3Z26_07920 [Bacteroidota bacterium]|nr:hypothetical protein [Bacteroidota bacterium]